MVPWPGSTMSAILVSGSLVQEMEAIMRWHSANCCAVKDPCTVGSAPRGPAICEGDWLRFDVVLLCACIVDALSVFFRRTNGSKEERRAWMAGNNAIISRSKWPPASLHLCYSKKTGHCDEL